MKFLVLLVLIFVCVLQCYAQCSICTKTAAQMGERPAAALNNAIVYLMATPLLIMGYVGYRWWKREKVIMEQEKK